jgi:uncharacterized repeat protein (TIGR02543 family)
LNSGNLRKAGYRLAGWNANSSGTGTPYALGASSVNFSSTKTLYAQWTPAVYSVIYAANGAAAGVEPSPVTFTFGSTVTVARNTGQLEKPGFTFGGWSTAPDGTGVTFEPEAANVALANDTVLFAKWVSAASVPISGGTTINPPQVITSPVTTKPSRSITISGFAAGSSRLTAEMKARIKTFVSKYSNYKSLRVVGFTEGPTILKSDSRLSKLRAAVARDFIQASLGYRANTALVLGSTKSVKSSALRRIQITLTD